MHADRGIKIWVSCSHDGRSSTASGEAGNVYSARLDDKVPNNAANPASVRPACRCNVDAVPGRPRLVAGPHLRKLQRLRAANATIFVVLLVCVLSVSSAIFLILEMGTPFDGLMLISSVPLRNALAPLPP
jgi:hypothetical protein